MGTKRCVLLTLGLFACSSSESPDQPPTTPGLATTAQSTQKVSPPKKKVQTRDEYLAYSFENNEVNGHLLVAGGLTVRGDDNRFIKYTRFSRSNQKWKPGHEADGKKGAFLQSKTGAFYVPTLKKGTYDFRLHIHSAAPQRLTIRLNGKKSSESTHELTAGWNSLSAEGQSFEAGDNEVMFFSSKGGLTVEYFQVGGANAPSSLETHSAMMAKGNGVRFYLVAPANSRVVGISAAGCPVDVTVAVDGGKTTTGQLNDVNQSVDLSKFAGKAIAVDLVAGTCQTPLKGAGIAVQGQLQKVGKAPPPEYVVLWVMDSLRADRVKTFNPKAKAETPEFDKLAKTGVLFTGAYVQGNESKASHASIWSALYPVKHGFMSGKTPLSNKWTTIDEVATKAGMKTFGVTSNGYVTRRKGFEQSWNKYSNHIHDGGGLKGIDILKHGLKFLEGVDSPWFLYLGTIDTHVSWRAKDPWIEKYSPGYNGRFKRMISGTDVGKAATGKLKLSQEEIEHIRAIYDSNVSYQDKLLADLQNWLTEKGIRDKTMIIITADHGDEQWEHGRVGHGGSLRESLVNVPLLIHYPPMFPGGQRIGGAETIDIVPTLAHVLGTEIDSEWQGANLLPLANSASSTYPRMVFASNFENKHAARLGDYKLIGSSGGVKLWDLAKTPGEQKQAQLPIAQRAVSDPFWILRAFNKQWKKATWGNAANMTAAAKKAILN